MRAEDVLSRCHAAGIRLRLDQKQRILASPAERLTDTIRALIRENKPDLLATLASKGADCIRCEHLCMRFEHQEGSRRLWWWRCAKGYRLLEGRRVGQPIVLAPLACHAAQAFEPWKPRP